MDIQASSRRLLREASSVDPTEMHVDEWVGTKIPQKLSFKNSHL